MWSWCLCIEIHQTPCSGKETGTISSWESSISPVCGQTDRRAAIPKLYLPFLHFVLGKVLGRCVRLPACQASAIQRCIRRSVVLNHTFPHSISSLECNKSVRTKKKEEEEALAITKKCLKGKREDSHDRLQGGGWIRNEKKAALLSSSWLRCFQLISIDWLFNLPVYSIDTLAALNS